MISSLTWSMNDPAGHLCTPSPNVEFRLSLGFTFSGTVTNPNEIRLRLGSTFSGSVTCLGYPQQLAGGLSTLPKELDEHRCTQI